jgi:polyhydroxybutyrate depolymerase
MFRMRAGLRAGSVVLALGGALAVIALSAPVASAATTPDCTLAPTSGLTTVMIGSRQYQLDVPPGLTGTSVPLLISLHGAGSNGTEDDDFGPDWSSVASADNFILAYPDAEFPDQSSLPGLSNLPYLDGGVWDPYTVGSTDVPFILSVVSNIESKYCINTSRVYVDGWSNGAVMSQRMACAAANVFAAADSYAGGDPTIEATYDSEVAPYLGQFAGAPCTPSRPISVAMIVGQEDFTYPALSENATLWEGVDGCGSTPVAETDTYGSQDTYSCADGTQVMTRVVDFTSHNWPLGAAGDDQRARIWSFFMANPLP